MNGVEKPGRLKGEYVLVGGLLVLLAFGLRTYGLEIQSLWADEGTSVALAPRSLVQIARDASHDIHPPLYYFTLHFWVALVGTRVFAVRALSAFYGTLLVALTYGLGRRWLGRWGGYTAGLAAAVSPLAIHYSQETRMYILMALCGALAWAWFDHHVRCPTGRSLAVWWLAALATIYTHYFGTAAVVAQNVVWALRAGRERYSVRLWIRWGSAQLALVAVYLPWLYYSRETLLNWPAVSQAFGPGFLAREVTRVFSLGTSVPPAWSPWLWGFLFLVGLAVVGVQWAGWPGLYAFAWWLVPPGLMLLLSALDRPFYNPKFLLVALPGYHLVLGLGAQELVRRVGQWSLVARLAPLLAVAFLLAAAVRPLRNEWTDPTYWRDDYRGIARTIEATAGPNDAILLLGPGQIEILDYYYKGPLPRYPLPRQRPLDPQATLAELEAIAQRHRRLYAVLWAQQESDPQGLIEGWLNANAFKVSDRWYGNVRLAIYEFGDLGDQLRPVEVRFGGTIILDQVAVAPPEVIAGDVVRVEMVWRTEHSPEVPLKVFAQLLDAGNHIVGQYDGPPAATPTEKWQPGASYPGRLGVPVLPGTPPSTYRLIVGLYDAGTGQRLPLPDGSDALELAEIRVRRPPVPPLPDALDVTVHRRVGLGEVTLLGWRFNKLGFDHAPETPLAPGEPLSVVLFWRAERAAPGFPSLLLVLERFGGERVAEWPWVPVEGRYLPERWEAGEVVRDPQVRFLPGNVQAGQYRLVLIAGEQRMVLGTISVE